MSKYSLFIVSDISDNDNISLLKSIVISEIYTTYI